MILNKCVLDFHPFFEATTTNTNNEIVSTDLYQLMHSNFTDLTINIEQLNAACSSNLKMSNDESKTILFINIFQVLIQLHKTKMEMA